MPFQGTVENAEIFNEVLWNEINTYQSYYGFAEVILALFALEFRRNYKENTTEIWFHVIDFWQFGVNSWVTTIDVKTG